MLPQVSRLSSRQSYPQKNPLGFFISITLCWVGAWRGLSGFGILIEPYFTAMPLLPFTFVFYASIPAQQPEQYTF